MTTANSQRTIDQQDETIAQLRADLAAAQEARDEARATKDMHKERAVQAEIRREAAEEKLARAREENDRLRGAILWALGMSGEFRQRVMGEEGIYYWRRELAQRAGIDMNAPPPAAVRWVDRDPAPEPPAAEPPR